MTTTTKNKKRPRPDDKEVSPSPAAAASLELHSLTATLSLVDPLLQFWTRATAQPLVSWKVLTCNNSSSLSLQEHQNQILDLHRRGILRVDYGDNNNGSSTNSSLAKVADWRTLQDPPVALGFPSMYTTTTTPQKNNLHASTRTAAKRRLAALKASFRNKTKLDADTRTVTAPQENEESQVLGEAKPLSQDDDDDEEEEAVDASIPVHEDERAARQALEACFQFESSSSSKSNRVFVKDDSHKQSLSCILPKQAAYAGSHPAQTAQIAMLQEQHQIPSPIWTALLGCRHTTSRTCLYTHQVQAISAALSGTSTMICTGTGSGKSLCFWLPVLTTAFKNQGKSIVVFPTKALAQDQLLKLQQLLDQHAELKEFIRPATLDGDTSHALRAAIAERANILLTNPDTIHAAILPHWKHLYRPLLQDLQYVVMDEAHVYQGIFGAHVALVLSRLARVVAVAAATATSRRPLTYLACSATLSHPQSHARNLLPVSSTQPILVITEDGSPRSAKHFFVWNPPILDDIHGQSIGKVTVPKKRGSTKNPIKAVPPTISEETKSEVDGIHEISIPLPPRHSYHRRHSADETALLLARLVHLGVRCIAFCKTRCLVEWVYEKTLQALPQDRGHLVESYRGGYSRQERRMIEAKLFQNKVIGVVATSALELGVDIGGVDVTLHCGYPSSQASLLQQAGRAGRGKTKLPSVAIVVCFNSPPDQHLWRHPSSLLQSTLERLPPSSSMPLYSGLVQNHLLAAGKEFPLVGGLRVSDIQGTTNERDDNELSDWDLFGSKQVYEEAIDSLVCTGSLVAETIPLPNSNDKTKKSSEVTVYRTHGSIKSSISIRSIEPVTYAIVDLSHPLQGNKMDGIHDERVVMDYMPYSRVFYHAFPGAMIMHRGRRFKIVSLCQPPPFARDSCRSMTLAAYAKPSNHRYMTRPLSSLHITVIKQIERVDMKEVAKTTTEAANMTPRTVPNAPPAVSPDVSQVFAHDAEDTSIGSFAGLGMVNVKRNVHGYKKLSLVNREEISRSELSLPDMEYDSMGLWLDCEASLLLQFLGNDYGHGVHALSHALVAVAPTFVPCVASDLECDHKFFRPTRITLFDSRAGGSGICAALWKCIFMPNGLVHAAVRLMRECPSCEEDSGYQGGCPACLQSGHCIKFNDYLSKSAGITIGNRLIERIERTELYEATTKSLRTTDETIESPSEPVSSPRRAKRARALRLATDPGPSSKQRHIVVGRPMWPLDEAACRKRQDAD